MTDDDAGVIPDARQTEPYRPCNGDEGMWFASKFCELCKHDAAFQKSGDGEDGCKIIPYALAYYQDHPEYPKEWVRDAGEWPGNPRCTAFELGVPADPAPHMPPGIIADARQIALPFHA